MDEVKISLLNNNLIFNKYIFADVQEYDNRIKINDFSLNVYKRLYIDYIVKEMDLQRYVKINNEILKVVKIRTYSDYQEVYVSEVENIKVNNIDKLAIIQEVKDKTIDYKNVIVDFEIKTGDIIQYQNKNWLIISEVSQNGTIYKAAMRKCRELKYNNQAIFGLVDSKIFDVEEGKFFNLVDNQILITISNANKIKLEDIIYFNNKAYKVIGVNDTIENILILRCQFDMTNTHIYNMEVIPSTIDIEENKTYQINIVCKKDNIIVDNPVVEYLVEDNTICTVDTVGIITAIKEGTTTIAIKYENVETIINVNVTAIPVQPTISYSIKSASGDVDYINLGSSGRTFKVINNDSTDIVDKTFTFNLEQSEKSSTILPNQLIPTVTIVSNTSVKLTANNSNIKGYFVLKAVCKEDNGIAKRELRVKATMDV